MQPIEVSELKAFFFALSQLDAPLPDAVQAQVNTIKIPADVGNLYNIAMSYPPLATPFENTLESLDAITKTRSKGPLPAKINQAAEQQNTEINNILVAIDEQVDEEELTQIATQTLQAADSVSAAKDSWAIIIRSLQMHML